MLNKIRKHPVACILLMVMFFVLMVAAKPDGISHFTSIWVGDRTDTADVTPGDNDLFVSGTLEVDGAARFDGGVTLNGTTDYRSFEIPLAALTIQSAAFMGADGTTAPGVALTDGIPKVTYASSAEIASIEYTFFVPPDYSGSNLSFLMMLSSDSDTSWASLSIPWKIWVNKSATAFDAAAFGQTGVSPTGTTFPATSNEVMTFTADATALAGIVAGDVVTVQWGNDTTRVGSYTTEITAIHGKYDATR